MGPYQVLQLRVRVVDVCDLYFPVWVGWLVGCLLWHINHYGLFNAKSSSHLHFLKLTFYIDSLLYKLNFFFMNSLFFKLMF